jgi:carbamoyltransferase
LKILAVHTMGHDTGLCVFEDGQLLFAVETERLTRVRHDHRVESALEHVWSVNGLSPDDIDLLVFSTNVRNSLAQIDDYDAIAEAIERGQLHAEGRSSLLGTSKPCLVVAHEASHAALACHHAGWPDGMLVLVNEGHGTFSRNSCFVHDRGSLKLVDHDALPWYGTGFGWTLLAYMVGFGRSPSAAGTLMATGGYGTYSAAAEAALLSVAPNVHLETRTAQERQLQPLFEYLQKITDFSGRADLVRTFQELFTASVHDYCAGQMAARQCSTLGLSGGCALNLHANTDVRRRLSRSLAIPPNCNDSGQAIGAAVYALQFYLGRRPEAFSQYSCGSPLDTAAARAAAERAGLRVENADPARIVDALAGGAVVALARGVSELGPRALGNRSLLASTVVPGMRERVSERIKERQWFRPLGCVMRTERFAELFPGEEPSPFMLFNYEMTDGLAPAATHVDGTSRIQTLDRDVNPMLWEILAEYETRTGEPALINTSLNGPRLPIAYSSDDVLSDFMNREVDVFVLENLIAWRPEAHNAVDRS